MARLFGTDGIRGRVGDYPLVPEMIRKIGYAAAVYVKETNPNKRKSQRISIAKDTRTSGDMFEQELAKGISLAGVDVILLGGMPTPCCAYLVREMKDDMGIVISASHNDKDDNGLKFFTHSGYKVSVKEEEAIEAILGRQEIDSYTASQQAQDQLQVQGKIKEDKEAVDRYLDFLKSIISGCDLSRYKIVMDCGFGAISYIIPRLKQRLGLDILSINDTPDGENINKEAGSLFPNAVSDAVMSQGADCGFTFDGDADRVLACDEKGQILDGDFLLAIFGKYLFDKDSLNKNTIVTTQMSNIGLEMSVSQWGARLIKTEVGDKFVLEKMLKGRLNLGGEQSGHIILLDHSPSGDGLLAALFLLSIMAVQGKRLSELARAMYKFPQVLVNVNVASKKPFEQLPKLSKAIARCESKLGSKGRLYIRYSGTEDKLRIMIEGQNQTQIKELAEEVANVAKEELKCQS